MRKILLSILTITSTIPVFADTSVSLNSNLDCSTTTPCYIIKSNGDMLSHAIDQGTSQKQMLKTIQENILPNFDFTIMTKLAMGNNWKQATDEQKSQLIAVFKDLLVNTYSVALTRFKGADVTINSSKIDPSGKKAAVTTSVILANDTSKNAINTEWDLVKANTGWKIYDMKVENASIIATYRSQIGNTIKSDGIDGLIKQLKAKVAANKKI